MRRSRNAALVGKSGIVVQETENTFKVVTRDDKLKGASVCTVSFFSFSCCSLSDDRL